MQTKPKQLKTHNELYGYMSYDNSIIPSFIAFISVKRWKATSVKSKYDKITVHVFDGKHTKPLYFDEELNIYENGCKANDEVQDFIKGRIDQFIIEYFRR